MFSGIVEQRSPLLRCLQNGPNLQICLLRPPEFGDLKIGDSVAVDGVCLTLLNDDKSEMLFDVGQETQEVLGWTFNNLFVGRLFNVERSLKLGDRIHGHWVTGHVDGMGTVTSIDGAVESGLGLKIDFPSSLAPFVWRKGSVCVQGVSLTVNEAERGILSVWLIPETLRRTNLSLVQVGQRLPLEADYIAKVHHQFLKSKSEAEHEPAEHS